MEIDVSFSSTLISVIISCYNHGKYLAKAIESVPAESYPKIEIIVVDDGSTDDTKQVCEKFESVKYIYQQNLGLSAARNTGFENSSGEFLVFLDADDWLLENAIKINLAYLVKDAKLAFVSGAHVKYLEDKNITEEKKIDVNEFHYCHFLKGNYVAMHATVLYRRWVFDQFRFDTSLRALEDYDMYLKVSRCYPVIHHQKLVAAYRIHDNNMSGNIPLMLESVLSVLKRQESLLLNKAEYKCYCYGLKYWKDYYSGMLYRNLGMESWSTIKKRKRELKMLFSYNVPLYIKLLLKKIINAG